MRKFTLSLLLFFITLSLFFLIFTFSVSIHDYLNQIYIPLQYNYVLEKVTILDEHRAEKYTVKINPDKRAELNEFREYNVKLGNEEINIEFRRDKGMVIYIETPNHALFNDLKSNDVEISYNDNEIEDFKIININDNSVSLNINNPYLEFTESDNEYITKHIWKLNILLQLSDGTVLKLQFDYNKYHTFVFLPSGEFDVPNNFLEALALKWIVGINYNQKKIDKNLSF